jgi:hypothetical protein
MTDSFSKMTGSPQQAGINPFARALAEAKGGNQLNTPLGQNLGESGDFNPEQMAEQQRLQAEKLKRDRLRLELHRQINPVETTNVFNAERQRTQKQIEEVRHELKLMITEIADFHAEIEVSLMSNVPDAGQEGKYYFNFFEKLKGLIQLLRQQIHSAQTWATSMQGKKKKKRNGGLEIGGKQYEQTATVFDRMHHERSTQYSGS